MKRFPTYPSLSDSLAGYRVGITLSRFQVDSSAEHFNARVLTNADFNPESESLALSTISTKTHCLDRAENLVRHQLQVGDVVASIRFVNFWVAYVSSVDTPCYANTNMAVLTPRQDVLLPEYLTLWLRSRSARAAIDKVSTQASKAGKSFARGFSAISLKGLAFLPASIPSLLCQSEAVWSYNSILRQEEEYLSVIRERRNNLQKSFPGGSDD